MSRLYFGEGWEWGWGDVALSGSSGGQSGGLQVSCDITFALRLSQDICGGRRSQYAAGRHLSDQHAHIVSQHRVGGAGAPP